MSLSRMVLGVAAILALALLQAPFIKAGSSAKPNSIQPANGFVPTERTASEIAEAVLTPIYGYVIQVEKPFKVELIDDVWIVHGTLRPNYVGGVFEIRIRKKDGTILYVNHTQ